MMSLMRRMNSEDFVIASVQGPNSFFVRERNPHDTPRIGFGWMMQYKADETIALHHSTLIDVIRDVESRHSIDPRSIFLVAFSQSVSLNYRFAFTHPDIVRGVIAVCGGIPGDWDQEKYRLSDTDVLIIAGDEDEFYPLERTRTFEAAIARRAKSVEFRSFDGGHVFPKEALPLINEWIEKRIIASKAFEK
jgi:phospholipase/carboxylesterase